MFINIKLPYHLYKYINILYKEYLYIFYELYGNIVYVAKDGNNSYRIQMLKGGCKYVC